MINYLTGVEPHGWIQIDTNKITKEVEDLLKKLEHRFMTKEQTTLFFCTWNMNAELPEKCHNFREIFDFGKKDAPDLVVIGFQELVDLDFKNTALTKQKQEK